MLRRVRLRFNVDVHARLEGRRANFPDQRQHILVTVDDIRTMVLHRQYDPVVFGNFGQFAQGVNHKLPAIAFPVPVLVVSIGLVVGGEAIVERDASPCREDLADWRPDVVRQLDALPRVADHRLPLDRHRTGKIAIRGDRAQRKAELTRQVAKPLAVIAGQVHRGRVRAFRVQFQPLPSLLLRQAYQTEDIHCPAPVPDTAVSNAVKSDLHAAPPILLCWQVVYPIVERNCEPQNLSQSWPSNW